MSGVEANISGSLLNSSLDPRDASEQEGLTAWQRLVKQYEPKQRTRFAGQPQALLKKLSWKFAGDIEGRMEAFEREVLRYEHASGNVVSDALHI
eukprot:6444077-Amphidinium_carterae.1